MRTRFSDKGFDAAGRRLKEAGLDVVRGAASEMQRESQRRAAVDSGELRRGIVLIPRNDGADVVATAPHSIYVERGTGRFTPGGRQTPWVYTPDGGQNFYTTTGMPAQPFFAISFDEAVREFQRIKKRRGL